MSSKNFWVLEGFGIECEKETKRFLESLEMVNEVKSLFLPELLASQGPDSGLAENRVENRTQVKKGDWIFFPGGFSFSDHFESGTLLAFELKKSGLLAEWLKIGANFFGVCNGFQILTKLGFFGAETRLLHNQAKGRSLGFINRWVKLEYSYGKSAVFEFPVRHGEGRLSAPSPGYFAANNILPLLRYRDENFENGSLDKIAGLVARQDRSWIVGMMPHPEIAIRENQGPFRFAGEAMPQHREIEQQKAGAGQRFFNQLFTDLQEKEL
jgi:phosphoribosylformylglycinamidine (FGAM) synthase-like amidotransferase family enzyme